MEWEYIAKNELYDKGYEDGYKMACEEWLNLIECEVNLIKDGNTLTPVEQCIAIKALHNIIKRQN